MVYTAHITTGGEDQVTTTTTPQIVWEEGLTIPFTIGENKVTLDHSLEACEIIIVLETNPGYIMDSVNFKTLTV